MENWKCTRIEATSTRGGVNSAFKNCLRNIEGFCNLKSKHTKNTRFYPGSVYPDLHPVPKQNPLEISTINLVNYKITQTKTGPTFSNNPTESKQLLYTKESFFLQKISNNLQYNLWAFLLNANEMQLAFEVVEILYSRIHYLSKWFEWKTEVKISSEWENKYLNE